MEDKDQETREALAGLIRFGYNEACSDLLEYIEWYLTTTQGQNHIDATAICAKLSLMVENKRELNWKKLQVELGIEETDKTI